MADFWHPWPAALRSALVLIRLVYLFMVRWVPRISSMALARRVAILAGQP